MRKRIKGTLLTAAAAGATITTLGFLAFSGSALAGSGYFTPTGGTPIGTDAHCGAGSVTPASDTVGVSTDCAQAGYVASGRDFRFAEALVTVPDHPGSVTVDPSLYVGLDASTSTSFDFARVGIKPCTGGSPCGTSGWEGFVAVIQPTLPTTFDYLPIPSVDEGDGVLLSVYFNQVGNSDNFTITLPAGTVYNKTVAVSGPTYTRAEALADWAYPEVAAGAARPEVPSSKVRDTQFYQGRFTTLSGDAGTFNGPWSLNAAEATSNGDLPPSGTLIGQPSYLWNDGSSYGGKGDDAFGIWRFPF